MPRIYDSASIPVDFCQGHFPRNQSAAFALLGQRGAAKGGPDGRINCFSYDAEHPDYMDDEYHCHACGVLLNGGDN